VGLGAAQHGLRQIDGQLRPLHVRAVGHRLLRDRPAIDRRRRSSEISLSPFGAILIDLSSHWAFFQTTSIPNRSVVTVPNTITVPLNLVFQDVSIDLSTAAGNTSNSVEVTIR